MTTEELALMDDYLDGKLPEDVRRAYETHLANNPKLAEELVFQKMLRTVVQARGRAKQMADAFDAEAREDGFYDQFHNPPPPPPAPPGTDWYRWVRLGGLLLLGLCALCAALFFGLVLVRNSQLKDNILNSQIQYPADADNSDSLDTEAGDTLGLPAAPSER